MALSLFPKKNKPKKKRPPIIKQPVNTKSIASVRCLSILIISFFPNSIFAPMPPLQCTKLAICNTSCRVSVLVGTSTIWYCQ